MRHILDNAEGNTLGTGTSSAGREGAAEKSSTGGYARDSGAAGGAPAGQRERGRHQTDSRRHTSGDMGLLTGPHQISCSEVGSLTMRLSFGERPVLCPEYAVNAPLDVMAVPVS